MLLGLALIAGPLLVAVVDAGHPDPQPVGDQPGAGARGRAERAPVAAACIADITSLERTARLYQVLGDPTLLDTYRAHRPAASRPRAPSWRGCSTTNPRAAASKNSRPCTTRSRSAVGSTPPGSPAFATILARFDRLNELADAIAESGNQQIDARLAELQRQTASTQQRLFWQSALLAPLTLIAILALTLSIGRPLRAIDRAISELGRGTFSRSIEVSGPRDLERLGAQLEWLRLRLLDLAQERNRFLRHMSHELKTPLANIREGAELLMDGAVGPLDNSQREVVAILRDNGIKLHRLIENLLSFSAWQKESVGLDLSEFRLRPLVKQVLESPATHGSLATRPARGEGGRPDAAGRSRQGCASSSRICCPMPSNTRPRAALSIYTPPNRTPSS